MRGMDQTPLFIYLTLPQHPFNRPRTAHCGHLFNLFSLFRNMHVYRHPGVQVQRLAQVRFGCGAQGMRRNADTRVGWQGGHRLFA